MKLTLESKNFSDAKELCRVAGVFQSSDKKNTGLVCAHKEYTDVLADLQKSEVFKAGRASTYFMRSMEGSSTLFVGLGKAEALTGEGLRNAGATLAKRLDAEKINAAALSLDSFHTRENKFTKTQADTLQMLGEGALMGMYYFDVYKSEKQKVALKEIVVYQREAKKVKGFKAAIDAATATAESVAIARDLSNEPGNILFPMELAKRAQKYAKEYGLTCKVLDMKALEKEKMGALIGVGQGSVHLPCLIVLEYKPKKKARKTIALVGKGVTFDSGGISLKPGAGMEDMKHDMSGAADVIAATILAARLGSPNHIVCVVAAAENMPDANAIVPSCILNTRNGKTIEAQNTDAEGRLILSDALDYAQDWKPDAIIDVATLTGAVVVALGGIVAGMMGNDEKLMNAFKDSAAKTEEKFWELPLYQEFSDDMKSNIADLKNIGGEKGAGSSKGGAFLKEFIKPGMKWLHLDIAGTAWNYGYNSYSPKRGASGHSVRTLTRFTMDY